ncbi:hypothetical protein FOZ62_025702 [Perkinsus olseni]|uniref:Uncharacterized protein n=1 Tax=Perkinsus olseni TaxID=32597 RepID=A0A7J6RSW1_PEROL|nr:hypothetical protein FOZ62_025702 [Perkinsus olseni]
MSKAGTVPIWVYAATGLHNSFLLGVDVLLQLQSVIIMDAQGVKIHTHCKESFSPVSELLNKKIATKKIPVQAQDITVKKTDRRSFPTTRDDLPELFNGTKVGASVSLQDTGNQAEWSPAESQQRSDTFDFIDDYTIRYAASLLASTTVTDVKNESVIQTDAVFDASEGEMRHGVHTLRFENHGGASGRIYVRHVHRLPWKTASRPTNNIESVRRRTEAQLSKLSASDYEEYAVCMSVLSERDIIRRFRPGEKPLFAMVHFGVRPAYKGSTVTTPLRPVWAGTGLVDYLDTPLGHVRINVARPLLLIRCHKHFHIEDLSRAFYSMSAETADFPYLAFWWAGDWWHFVKCPMGIPSSPAQLAFSIETIIEDLQHNTYDSKVPTVPHVDDIAQGFSSPRARDRVHSHNVTAFTENSFEVNAVKRVTDEDENVRVLGIWLNDQDEFTLLAVPPLGPESERVTLQQAVRYASSCFDPLGLAAETTTYQRLLIRECYTLGLDKRDPLPDHIHTELLKCRQNLLDMQPLKRYTEPYYYQGHPVYFCFVDASIEAISLVITARGHDRIYASGALVPKGRHLWTIVRLELAAIETALPHVDLFCDCLKDIPKLPIIVIATDSDINVARINSDKAPSKSLCQWDRSAILKLREELRRRGWLLRHVPGIANPADSISRPSTHAVRARGQATYHDRQTLEGWIQETLESLGYQNSASSHKYACCAVTTRSSGKAKEYTSIPPELGYTTEQLQALQQSDDHLRAIIVSLRHPQQPLRIRVQLRYYYLDANDVLRYKIQEGEPEDEKTVEEDALFGKSTDPVVIPSHAARLVWTKAHNLMSHPGTGSCFRRLSKQVRQLEAAVSTATLASNETPRPQTTITPNQLMRVNGLRMQSIIRVVDSDIKQPTREYIDTLLEPKQPTEAQVQVIHNTFARTLRQYMDMWSSPSLKRFGRSSKTVSTDSMCAIGDKVFFWRPRKSKLQSCWKEATVLDISRDKRTITIRRADGSISNEYYYNIAMLGGEAAAGVCQPTVGSRDDVARPLDETAEIASRTDNC